MVVVTLGGITGGQLRWWLGLLPARPIMADAAMDRNSLPRPGCMVALFGDAPGIFSWSFPLVAYPSY